MVDALGPVAAPAYGSTAQAPGGGTSPQRPGSGSDQVDLSPEAQKQVEALRKADAQVHAHEAAHLGAAAGLARGGATYTYTRGPDGKLYATGGEVSIDTSAVSGDPAATLAKAQRIQAAALAPADPSPQDRAVAAAAAAMAAKASAELAKAKPGGADAAPRLDLRA
jgi:hypothetical protein